MVLKEVSRLFNAAAKTRPNAKNVLVVIADKKSDSRGEDLKRESLALKKQDIKVIAVAFGEESDTDELDILLPEQGEVIVANSTDGAKKTSNEIMNNALEGKNCQVNHCTSLNGGFFVTEGYYVTEQITVI